MSQHHVQQQLTKTPCKCQLGHLSATFAFYLLALCFGWALLNKAMLELKCLLVREYVIKLKKDQNSEERLSMLRSPSPQAGTPLLGFSWRSSENVLQRTSQKLLWPKFLRQKSRFFLRLRCFNRQHRVIFWFWQNSEVTMKDRSHLQLKFKFAPPWLRMITKITPWESKFIILKGLCALWISGEKDNFKELRVTKKCNLPRKLPSDTILLRNHSLRMIFVILEGCCALWFPGKKNLVKKLWNNCFSLKTCRGGEHRRGEGSETFLERKWVVRRFPELETVSLSKNLLRAEKKTS